MSDKARTVSDVAVRKASRERLLRDFAWAADQVAFYQFATTPAAARETALAWAAEETSRTRYACLMTAFGL